MQIDVMNNSDGSAKVMMDANGPQFYVDDDDVELTRLTETMDELLQALDEGVRYENIRQHMPITTVEWRETGNALEYDVKPISVDGEWYAEEPVHSFE